MPTAYTQNLISDLGLKSFPPDMADDIIDRFGEVLFRAVLMQSAESLDPDAREELAALMDADADFEDLIRFLESHVKHFHRIVREEGSNIRKELFAEN